MSPTTRPYLSVMNLVNEARVDFDQLLNNLSSSGSRNHPSIVHAVLGELLHGWVNGIRTEFGPDMEIEAARLTQGLRKGP